MAKLTSKAKPTRKKKHVKVRVTQEIMVSLDSFRFYDDETDDEVIAKSADEIVELIEKDGDEALYIVNESCNLWDGSGDWEIEITDVP